MKSIVLSIVLCMSPVIALAQTQPTPGSGDRRAAFLEACGQDVQTYCASAQGRDARRTCIRANHDKFSQNCQSFLASHFAHSGHQGDNGTNP
jgi:hypothetical protein